MIWIDSHFIPGSVGAVVSAVLFGTALFVTLAGISFDIYLQVKGCCSLFPDACVYQQRLTDARKEIDTNTKIIDTNYVKGELTMTSSFKHFTNSWKKNCNNTLLFAYIVL